MKLIFLDIDGVLNDWERSWRDVPDYNPEIVPRCVRAFNRIVCTTGAQIILSSSWRYLITRGHFSLYGFRKLLSSHGVRGELIAHTREDDGDEDRWKQIADWLRKPPAKIDGYCILDDDPDAFGGRPGVLTAGGIGLTESDADEAIEILRA